MEHAEWPTSHRLGQSTRVSQKVPLFELLASSVSLRELLFLWSVFNTRSQPAFSPQGMEFSSVQIILCWEKVIKHLIF